MLFRLLVVSVALYALPATADEWWQSQGCELTENPDVVYCPPEKGADPSAPATDDLHPRDNIPLYSGQLRVRDSYIEEYLTRGEMQDLMREQRNSE